MSLGPCCDGFTFELNLDVSESSEDLINLTRVFVRATAHWQECPPDVLEIKNQLVNLCNSHSISADVYCSVTPLK